MIEDINILAELEDLKRRLSAVEQALESLGDFVNNHIFGGL